MKNTEELLEKKEKRKRIIRKFLNSKVLVPVIAILAVGIVILGVKSHFSTEGKTTKLGFEDIGELATQAANCTSVRVEDKERTLLGVSLPFTQTKYIYTYDTVIKAGIDFSAVKVDDKGGKSKEIYVDIPEVKVLSIDVDFDSFQVYHEDESVFAPISLKEHNDAMKDLEETAQKDAVANGLLDNAYDNAKRLLTAFLGQTYDPDEYTIKFSDKK